MRGVSSLSCVFAVLGAFAVAGCGADSKKSTSASGPRGATVAFESINGPPEAVFQKLVERLNEEAQSRRLAVVSRSTPSVYRVRGYLTARKERGKTSVSWIWDVLDAQQHRALRITGAETVPSRSRNIWAAADDELVRKIARICMDQLAAFLNSPEASPPAAPAAPVESNTFTMASTSSASPEVSGIFRIFQAKDDPTPAETAPSPAPGQILAGPIPLPPRRPPAAEAASGRQRLTVAASDR